jgi:hypothetical protein
MKLSKHSMCQSVQLFTCCLSYHLAASCLSEDFSSSYRYLPIGTTRAQPQRRVCTTTTLNKSTNKTKRPRYNERRRRCRLHAVLASHYVTMVKD